MSRMHRVVQTTYVPAGQTVEAATRAMIRGLMRAIERDYPRAERQPPRIEIDPDHELGTKIRVTIGFVPRELSGELPVFRLVSSRPFRVGADSQVVAGPVRAAVASLTAGPIAPPSPDRARAGHRPRTTPSRSYLRRTERTPAAPLEPSVTAAP